MTQTVTTDLRAALIEGSESGKALNYAHDFTDLLGDVQNERGFFQTLESNLSPTDDGDNLEIGSGVAFVKYNKTSGAIGFLKFELTVDKSIDLSSESDGTYYCFIELDGDKVDDGSEEIDGSDVVTLKVDSSLPASGDYLEICSLTKSGTTLTITDLREMVKLSIGELSIAEKKLPHAKIYEFGLEYGDSSLDVNVLGGVYLEDGSTASDTELTLSASTTNYIEIDPTTGVISNNTSAFSGIALYEVVTDASGVTSVIDKRQAFIGSQGGGEVANTEEALAGTNDTKFMSPLKTAQAMAAQFTELSGQTTDATETEIFVGGVSSERIDIPASSAMNFDVLMTGRSSDDDVLSINIRGAIQRDDADNTSFVYEPEIYYNGALAGELRDVTLSGNSCSIGSQESTPKSLVFSTDGTKAYALGTSNKSVYQYSLSTPWDVSTMSYASKSTYVGSLDSNPTGLCFSTDGTKMYIVGITGDYVYQYTLTTAWDLDTASSAGLYISVSSQDGSARSIAISDDGVYFYMLGSSNDKVYQYTLSTPYNISTATYKCSYDITGETDPRGMCISPDGKYMYITGYINKNIMQYKFGIPYDVNSLVFMGTGFYAANEETDPCAIAVSANYNKFYVLGTASDTVYEYNVPSAWGVSVEADDTNEALVLKVTGEASTTIDWQAKVISDLNQD